MTRAPLAQGLSLMVFVVTSALPAAAFADDPYALAPDRAGGTIAPVTWGVHSAPFADATSVARDSPVNRARELLLRARFLDEAAGVDEKAATELAGRLASLRTAAKAARDRADRATPEERELLGARAEDLETDVVVSEAEVTFKRKTAGENRRVARDLRVRAVKLVRETPAREAEVYDPRVETAIAVSCDPPFRFTADGRKIYRVECLK